MEEYLVTHFEREYLLAPNEDKADFFSTYTWKFPWHHLTDNQTGASLFGDCIVELLERALSELYELVVRKAYSDSTDTHWCDKDSEGILHMLQTYYKTFLDIVYQEKEGRCLPGESFWNPMTDPTTTLPNSAPLYGIQDYAHKLGALKNDIGYRSFSNCGMSFLPEDIYYIMENDTSGEDYEYYADALGRLWGETELDDALDCVFHTNATKVFNFTKNWMDLATRGLETSTPRWAEPQVIMWSAAKAVIHDEKACLLERKWAEVTFNDFGKSEIPPQESISITTTTTTTTNMRRRRRRRRRRMMSIRRRRDTVSGFKGFRRRRMEEHLEEEGEVAYHYDDPEVHYAAPHFE